MKKIIILLFCSFSLTLFSQVSVYKPFCNNPSWTTAYSNFGGISYATFQYQLDTTIGVYTYKKMIHTTAPYSFVLFREDSVLKRVYQYDIPNSIDYLYIDFNLNIGNTFTVTIVNGPVISTTVTAKNSVMINGSLHNALFLSSSGSYFGFKFVEGILSDINPLNPYFSGSDPVVTLACMCHNNQFYYRYDSLSCGLNCSNPTVLKETQNVEKTIRLFPNPSDQIINLESNLSLEGKKFLIQDYTGKEISNGIFHAISGVDILGLSNGIYFLKINNTFLKFIKN